MPVKNSTRGIGYRIGVVVTFYQDGVKSGNRTGLLITITRTLN